MEKSFNTLAELQAEIDLLKINKFNQEEELKSRFDGPRAIFSTITSLLKGNSHNNNNEKSFLGDLVNQDFITNISRVVLPAILNMFVFKRSGFITKAIVTFLSQKAAKKVNANVVVTMIDKIKHIFNNRKATQSQKARIQDYGIPPDSETY